jgi:hypothetical protein
MTFPSACLVNFRKKCFPVYFTFFFRENIAPQGEIPVQYVVRAIFPGKCLHARDFFEIKGPRFRLGDPTFCYDEIFKAFKK